MSGEDDENRYIKIVVVGDTDVGKTVMVMTYATNRYSSDYGATLICDDHTVTVNVGETSYQLGLFDTSGLEDYDPVRAITYPGTHVFLICYSVVMPDSMENVFDKWVPEVRNNSPTSAFLIVGTQTDLRDDQYMLRKLQQQYRSKPATYEKGAILAKKVNADGYVECSSLTQKGIKDVFDEAILAVLFPKIKRRAPRRGLRKCVIL